MLMLLHSCLIMLDHPHHFSFGLLECFEAYEVNSLLSNFVIPRKHCWVSLSICFLIHQHFLRTHNMQDISQMLDLEW